MSERVNEWTSEGINELASERVKELTNEGINEWTSEGINEWIKKYFANKQFGTVFVKCLTNRNVFHHKQRKAQVIVLFNK